MFIIDLKYQKTNEDVDKFLPNHIEFLNKYYEKKKFLCSGRKNPRKGGIIICMAEDVEEVNAIIKNDPFYQNNIATYEIIEFIPSKCAEGFENLMK